MSRVEEPPIDFDESLRLKDENVNASPSTAFPVRPDKITTDGQFPTLPPQMQGVRSHTADEIVQMMGRTPLFMTSLDDADKGEENVELEAIRALQYDGTPAENALSFKEQGNELVKLKKWSDAKEFYTKAIAVLSKNIGDPESTAKSEEGAQTARASEAQAMKHHEEKEIEEACFVNRALCNLELRNYRSTTLDCASALCRNALNVKAYYRSSQALLALDKIEEAVDACEHGLAVDSGNSALKNLANRIAGRKSALKAAQNKTKQQAERAQREKHALASALRSRNIRVRKTAQQPDLEDASIQLTPDPLTPGSTLKFPVLLLYPVHAQSDLIKAFSETETVPQHLEYIFPLPWDEKHEYQIEKVELYMETSKGGLIKIGKNMSLVKILGSGDVEVVDELVKINVLPKSRAASWIEELKARKGV